MTLMPSPGKPYFLRLIQVPVSSFSAARSLPCSIILENCPNPWSINHGSGAYTTSWNLRELSVLTGSRHLVCRDLQAVMLKSACRALPAGKAACWEDSTVVFLAYCTPQRSDALRMDLEYESRTCSTVGLSACSLGFRWNLNFWIWN